MSEYPLARKFAFQAKLLLECEEYTKAIRPLEKAKQLEPAETAHLYNLGYCYFKARMFKRAVHCFMNFTNHEPESWEGWYHLGMSCAGAGRLLQAEQAFYMAINLAPGSPLAHWGLCNVLEELGKTSDALDAADFGLECCPNHIGLKKAFATLSYNLRDYESAQKIFSEILWITPMDSEIHHKLGMIRLHENDLRSAVQHLERALRANTPSIEIFINLSSNYISLEQFADAVPVLEKAALLDPTSRTITYKLVRCYRKLGMRLKLRALITRMGRKKAREP